MIRIFIITILLVANIFALENLYFLPKDGKKTMQDIELQIKNAKESIDIAVYNISYRKLVNLLNEASLRGVKVKIFYFKKKADFSDNVEVIKIKDKLHTKVAIIDKKIVIFGSANWTEESFKENYEVFYISDRVELSKQFNQFFESLEKNKRNQIKE